LFKKQFPCRRAFHATSSNVVIPPPHPSEMAERSAASSQHHVASEPFHTPRGLEDAQILPSLQKRVANAGLVLIFGVGYVCVSAGLIAYNKYLIHADRFPFAVPLVFIHAVFCSCCCLILYLVQPKLFPSLSDPERKVKIDCDLIFRGALPIALMFSGQLALSNTAYLHSSVAFLQMMKEANLALVYTMSLAVAIEGFNWRGASILVAVVAATLLTIHGELHFSLTGFTIQGMSQFFECTKIVLQAMMLSQAGRKLDALTYVLVVMPLCAVLLGSALLFLVFVHPTQHLMTPTWAVLMHWWPHLLANACVAFALNVVIALFVKHSSAVAFILAGMVKDAMIVFTGVLFLSEIISALQAIGFTMQLGLIFVYTLTKNFPDEFEQGLLPGLRAVLSADSCRPSTALKVGTACRNERDYGAFEEGKPSAYSNKGHH